MTDQDTTDKSEQAADEQEQQLTEKPEVTEEHREAAKEMARSQDDSRETVVMPGTSNTVTGTAVSEWLDDDGKPKYGEVAEGGIKREDVMGGDQDARGHETDE
ncbi:hypothetical protein [Mycolicibacterium lacusdiani]|uniref:hypothetical protein n=1 Tax=Mycolicibacterium lacusdiani TaxID=2895283 RepID=UPI001F1F8E28|nr:hypothetical protein [Mycolicibacterium lacusdiani]